MSQGQIQLLQLTSSPQPAENFSQIRALLANSPPAAGDLLLLPENFALFGAGASGWQQHAEALDDGPVQRFASELARHYQVTLVAGTHPIRSHGQATASSLIYGPDGQRIGRYDKIHLFDVDVADGTGSYRESAYTQAGNQLCLFDWQGVKVGVMVCYDLRFPELARLYAQGGAQLLAIPAAFTAVTGAAHWQLLLRARAVENQLFVAACGQCGNHPGGRQTWGHSQLIDPWGEVLATAGEQPAIISARPDWARIAQIRQAMPLAQHNRFSCHWQED